jgi:lipid II isoglutaminyl synthase (glutamine-hydrolysing)
MPAAPRALLAIAAGKAAQIASRRLGRGGGTSLPGVVAGRIDPGLLPRLAGQLPLGVVMVAGTNGKTTTARMLADILTRGGHAVVHNRSGANLLSGMTTAFVAAANLGGRVAAPIAVMEADEFALPAAIERLRPRLIVLNNLFRDQLDRYGELDTIARLWRAAVNRLDTTTTLLVNGDDPMLVGVVRDLPPERAIFFGLDLGTTADDRRLRLDHLPHAADAAHCTRCGARLAYHALYLSHLGDWYCPACGHARPPLTIAARAIRLEGVKALTMEVGSGREPTAVGAEVGRSADHASAAPASESAPPPSRHELTQTHFSLLPSPFSLHVPLPGLYNAYNALAATTAALAFGVDQAQIAAALGGFRAAFGRIERVPFEGREIILALVKNPTGFNEVLRMLVGGETAGVTTPTLLAINDLDADGRDVSWLWDVDFEVLTEGTAPLHTAGIRGPDMAVRLKYAGVATDRIVPHPPDDLRRAILDFVRAAPDGATLYILPTYTAMLEIRRNLADLGAVKEFWQQ